MFIMWNWKRQKHGRRLVFPTLPAAQARGRALQTRGYIVGLALIGLHKVPLWHW